MDSTNRQEEGSYHVSSFSANMQAEIRRLDAQVDLFWPSEKELISRAGLKDGMDYLDCGCGPGRLIELLKEQHPDLKCTGLEMDPILVKAATQKVSARGYSDCSIIQGTAEKTGLPDSSFDFITMRLVLEHVPDPVLALKSLKRLLRPGGKIFIISNDFENHTRTWPPVPELANLYDAYRTSRREDQGDPCIGRRVPRILASAGLKVIAQQIEVAHNLIAGDEAFFQAEGVGIPAELVSSGYLDQSVFESMIQSWKAMINDPDHCITRQLCIAIGEFQPDATHLCPADEIAATQAASRTMERDDADNVPPGTDSEKRLAKMWCDAMQLERVSIRDNFFDLGGTSLKLEQIHARMQEELGFREPITTLFQYPTIETLAEYIGDSASQSSTGGSADPGSRRAASSAVNIRAQARKRRGAFGMKNSPDDEK